MATSSLHYCEEHGKILVSYCKRPDAPLCLSCVKSRHKSCEEIVPLANAAKNAKQSTALTDLQETLSVGLKNIQTIIQNITPEYLVKDEKKIKVTIREVRAKIDHQLDEMEQNLILDLNSKLALCKSKINEVVKCMKKSEKIMKHLKDQTNELKNCASDLHIFIKTRELNKEVHECLKTTMTRNVIEKYNINVEFDKALKSFPTDVEAFGIIHVEVTKTHVQLSQPNIAQAQKPLYPVTKSISDIEVNLKQTLTIKKESKHMEVTGCAILPNGHMLIADNEGKAQLMEYYQNGTHVRDIPVSRKPFDITVIDSDRVAVSYGGSCNIEIINIQNKTVEKKVDLDNTTFGLSYQGGKLYAVVNNRGIVVIDISGEIVNTININVNYVLYVTTTTDRIYYSDNRDETVTCCHMSGKQIWKFKADAVRGPFGLTVDNNQNVLFVGLVTHNVAVISRDGQMSKTLLSRSDGLFSPQVIDLDKHTGDLFVCDGSDTKVFLFKVM